MWWLPEEGWTPEGGWIGLPEEGSRHPERVDWAPGGGLGLPGGRRIADTYPFLPTCCIRAQSFLFPKMEMETIDICKLLYVALRTPPPLPVRSLLLHSLFARSQPTEVMASPSAISAANQHKWNRLQESFQRVLPLVSSRTDFSDAALAIVTSALDTLRNRVNLVAAVPALTS